MHFGLATSRIEIILINAAFRVALVIREEVLIRGRRLFQCGCPKVPRLLKGGPYLRLRAWYSTKILLRLHYSTTFFYGENKIRKE